MSAPLAPILMALAPYILLVAFALSDRWRRR